MMKFLLGLIIGLCVLPAAGYMYLRMGLAPVATAAPAMPFEKRLARMALHARISKEAPAQAPVAGSEDNLAAGARIYREHCAYCHGIAGQAETNSPKGMFPHPPQFLESAARSAQVVPPRPVKRIFPARFNSSSTSMTGPYTAAGSDHQSYCRGRSGS